MEGGRLKAALFVDDERPRDWTKSEFDFVRGVFDRTYAAIERVRAVGERELMNRELAHRMKNVLTIAQVIAGQSLRHTTTLRAGRMQVTARLNALGRAQDMLTDEGTSRTNVRSVILDAMEPHLSAPERLVLDGPHIELDEQQVLGLSLAIHELATNAGKYGALLVPEGLRGPMDVERRPRLQSHMAGVGRSHPRGAGRAGLRLHDPRPRHRQLLWRAVRSATEAGWRGVHD